MSEAQVTSIFTSDAMTSSAPSPSEGAHCGHVIFDLSVVRPDSAHTDLLDILTRSWRDFYSSMDDISSKPTYSGIVVVTVILGNCVHMDMEGLLPLLVHTSGGSAASHVSSVVSVVNAASVLGTGDRNTSSTDLDLDKATALNPAGAAQSWWRVMEGCRSSLSLERWCKLRQ